MMFSSISAGKEEEGIKSLMPTNSMIAAAMKMKSLYSNKKGAFSLGI